MCFKKKIKESGFYSDRKLLLLLSQEFDLIHLIAQEKKYENIQEFLKIKDMLMYISPSDSEILYDLDVKIKAKVQDLKLHLMREDIKDFTIIDRLLKDLKIMIKDRDVRELK